MKRGQNTIGYGRTKAVCEEGSQLNMSIEEVAKKHGLSIGAVRTCAARNRITLRNTTGRQRWGVVKAACLEGLELGLTRRQIAEKYGLKLNSVKRTANTYKMNFNEIEKD